ncbi:hypothetical protein H6P81_019019 [Aristolochia fimbriata]|uniref:Uncharacterized protein n=1 Tax=Aristolochia fimbriata TaxID=158543 RepID=A0AAV7E2N6_ARIFI|nr:hypothetical protein H6P81_019019 [Aristolochia fimbriata]
MGLLNWRSGGALGDRLELRVICTELLTWSHSHVLVITLCSSPWIYVPSLVIVWNLVYNGISYEFIKQKEEITEERYLWRAATGSLVVVGYIGVEGAKWSSIPASSFREDEEPRVLSCTRYDWRRLSTKNFNSHSQTPAFVPVCGMPTFPISFCPSVPAIFTDSMSSSKYVSK